MWEWTIGTRNFPQLILWISFDYPIGNDFWPRVNVVLHLVVVCSCWKKTQNLIGLHDEIWMYWRSLDFWILKLVELPLSFYLALSFWPYFKSFSVGAKIRHHLWISRRKNSNTYVRLNWVFVGYSCMLVWTIDSKLLH